MGKHTSAGAALAQHGMSERASQSQQPSPPPPDRSRAPAKRGLDSTLDLLELPLPSLLSRQRGGMGGRGPRGSPRSQGVPPACAPGVAACAEHRTRGGCSEPGVEAGPDGRLGPPNAAGAGRGAGLSPVLAGPRVAPAALPRAGRFGERPPCAPAVPEEMDRSNFRGRTLPPSPVCRAQQPPRVPRARTRLLV